MTLENGDSPAWSSRQVSKHAGTKFSPVLLRSTRWPGATVIAYNDKFTNIYVGWGHKEQLRFVPPKLALTQKEYAPAAEVEGAVDLLVEQLDPTIEQEKAFEDEKKAKEQEGKEGEEGEAEAEEDEDA